MSDTAIVLLFLSMALVTYIPRMLPFVLVDRLRFSPRMERFLRLIPYTAMAALIFPGILSVDAARPWAGLLGGAAAALLALRKRSAILCVLAAIAVVFVLQFVQ